MTRAFLALLLLPAFAFAADPPAYRDAGPPAYAAQAKAACGCGDGCDCPPGGCPGSCFVDPSRSTVKVSHDMGGGASGHGTGVVVAAEGSTCLVLTNKHVAPTQGRYVASQGGKVYAAEWLGACATNDLALLRVSASLPAVLLADAEPLPSTSVVLWGHPHGGPLRKLVGRTLGREGSWRAEDGGQVYGVQINTVQGDSGAGLFDSAGRLVAVNWGGVPGRASMVPLGDVRAFLGGKAPKKTSPADPYATVYERVSKGEVVTLAVGVPAPFGARHVASLPGVAPGVYTCSMEGGRPVMRLVCPNGRCPNAR